MVLLVGHEPKPLDKRIKAKVSKTPNKDAIKWGKITGGSKK